MSAVSTGSDETSVFHGLSFGKTRQPAAVVPGPAVPPLELLELLDEPPLDDAPPSDDDDDPHATSSNTTAEAPIRVCMLRSYAIAKRAGVSCDPAAAPGYSPLPHAAPAHQPPRNAR